MLDKPKGWLRYNKTSTYLITLSLILMLSVISMASLIHHVYRSLEHDAYLINHTGIVRGSIQRYSKLALDGCDWKCGEIEKQIDNEIILVSDLGKTYTTKSGNDFLTRIANLEEQWNKLKEIVALLPVDDTNKGNFIDLSELSWEIADAAVLVAEINSAKKLSALNVYYFILGMTILGFAVIITFIYLSVRKSLEKEVSLDHLTSLKNLKTFDHDLNDEINRSKRYEHKFTLAMFDIDNFKSINDKQGHDTGDKALVEVANLVRNSLRSSDSIYRLGGDEFAVIFTETGIEEAIELAEKLRQRIANIGFLSMGSITISIGLSEYSAEITASEILKKADDALYQAKRDGKNKVVSACA